MTKVEAIRLGGATIELQPDALNACILPAHTKWLWK